MNTYNKLLFLIIATVFISFKTLYKTVHNIPIISTGVATRSVDDAPVLANTTTVSILDESRNESSTSTRTTTSISDNEKQQQVEDPLVSPVVSTSFSSSRRENNHTDIQSLASSNVTKQLLDEDFQNRNKNSTSEHSNEWQSEDNNSNKQDEEKYITYKLIQGGADYNFTFDPNKHRCRGNPKRGHLPILHEKGVTDFRTVIETNLNIAYIGDSVGLQFSQSFQDAAGASYAQVIRYAWGWHALSHIAKVRGGGIVAGMRLTGPFLEKRKNHPEQAAPIGGGGWLEYDLREMKRLLHRWRNVTSLSNAYEKHNTEIGQQCNGEIDVNSTAVIEECMEEDFDVLVYQLPAGWMHTPNQLLNESMSVDIINRTVFDALKYFAPKTIILQTIPIINNVLSVEEYIAVNRNILKVVHEFRKQQSEGVTMLVMDVRALSTSLLMHNAIHIHALTNGTVPDATTADNDTFVEASSRALHDIDYSLLNNENYFNSSLVNAMRSLLKQRLRKRIHKQHWSSIISHTCGQFIQPNTAARCHKGNEYSWDGQHWCMDTMSGRIDGVVACLLECSVTMTKKRFLMHENDAMERFLDECEHRCNSQFMSLSPIPLE